MPGGTVCCSTGRPVEAAGTREIRRVQSGVRGADRLAELKRYLAGLAAEIGDECLFLEFGEDAWFVYAAAG